MGNLTLDIFWISFMPIYQHVIGAVTAIISAAVIYLMVTKTPEYGKPLARYLILIQVSIFLCDFCWDFLVAPVFLFPLTALLCTGIICGTDPSRHAGVVLLFQVMIQVALAITYTFHYKYTKIVRMTNRREVTIAETAAVRIFFWIILELPVAGAIIAGASVQDLHQLLIDEQEFTLAAMVETNPNVQGIGYSIPRFLWIPITEAVLVVSSLVIVVSGSVYFVVHTLLMLSTKTTTMSDRTRNMQRGLVRTLVMQTTVPFIIQCAPIVIGVGAIITKWSDPGTMNFMVCGMLCHAIFHTIFLILTTPSYRAAVMCLAQPRKETMINSIASVVKI